MVNYRAHDLDCVFATLADPTPRAILARLERGADGRRAVVTGTASRGDERIYVGEKNRGAPRDRVRGDDDAGGVASWWGPEDLPVVRAESDARIGGTYRVHFRTSDGHAYEAHGEFLKWYLRAASS